MEDIEEITAKTDNGERDNAEGAADAQSAAASGAVTLVNAELAEYERLHNGREDDLAAENADSVPEGTVLCEKYTVIRRLEVISGEAEIYLCTDGEERYAAKIYRRRSAVKKEVSDALRRLDSPYVAKLFAVGSINGRSVEILPFYEKGSLQGKTFSEEELILRVIPDINEGLHAIHEAGILHKDVKPSNIMINDDGHLSLIDFGVSSAVGEGNTVLVTHTGMTPEYSAPETFRSLFLIESDYYSFGVTLFELFCGYTPYANMQPEEIEQYVALQRIPFPGDMPLRLRELISALTYNDISCRGDKENPNRRWTWDEVRRWLAGEDLPLPGERKDPAPGGVIPPFAFHGEEYTDISGLVAAFCVHWEEAKRLFVRGEITKYFRTFDSERARKCIAAEEEAGGKTAGTTLSSGSFFSGSIRSRRAFSGWERSTKAFPRSEETCLKSSGRGTDRTILIMTASFPKG